MFDLHPRLASDTLNVCSLPLSRVLLMNDARYPWIILVPERPDLVEMHDLNDDDYALLSGEIREASKRMATLFGAHKMNVAALGNMVPQLHVHVIARPA
ncbi:HIT domain-containing protein [uncultured Sneathiella sp.]|jgi:diadenosine tetraphosphate (Ap4A) HIT family hydrolase|uniref:HIT domain-containing protein n=1 Tax=uncultured Sneathiella sp. TaxID=879315 RepID=UPI0030DC01B9|tara:strand:+ start:18003 stop:18299 length:297 start_codon:yes stop_codon:yes gene_type:complete